MELEEVVDRILDYLMVRKLSEKGKTIQQAGRCVLDRKIEKYIEDDCPPHYWTTRMSPNGQSSLDI